MTTFGVGGPARYFAAAKTAEDLGTARQFAAEKNIPFFILGGGSNILMADEGFLGLVVKIEFGGIAVAQDGEQYRLTASAGEDWDGMVAHAIQNNLWGIENLSGIPGTFGGAIVQNIGAYGQAISEVVDWVEAWDAKTNEVIRMSPDACAFEYRDSAFKHDGNLVVVCAALKLSKTPHPNLSYRDLDAYFRQRQPDLSEIRSAVLTIRKDKFPDLKAEGTAGSFFKNPMLPRETAQLLQRKYPDMPLFDMPETANMKVPLAWLLDKILHLNGFRLGKARLFENQPIVLVADKGATAAEVRALAEHVRVHVRTHFGFEIEEEVKVIANSE